MYWEAGTSGAWRAAEGSHDAHPDIIAALRQYGIAEEYLTKLVKGVRFYRLPFYRFYDLYELTWHPGYQAGLFANPATSPHYGSLRDPESRRDWRSYVLLRRLDPGDLGVDGGGTSVLPPIWLTGISEEIEAAGKAEIGGLRNLDFGATGTSGFYEKISAYLRFFAAFRDDRSGHGTFQLFEDRAALEEFLGEPDYGTDGQRLADLNPFHAGKGGADGEPRIPRGLELGPGATTSIFWSTGTPFSGADSRGIVVLDGYALADRLSVHGGGISRAILAAKIDPDDRDGFGQVRMLFDEPLFLFLPRVRFEFDDSARISFIDFDGEVLTNTALNNLRNRAAHTGILGDDITIIWKPEDLVRFVLNEIAKKRNELQGVGPSTSEKHVFRNLVLTCPIDLGALARTTEGRLPEPFGLDAVPGPGHPAAPQTDVLLEILRRHVEFTNCLFIGNFTIDFQIFRRAVAFRDCVFLDAFSASFANVGENFSLDRCTFARSAHCEGLRVQGKFESKHCQFVSEGPLLRLRNADVKGDLSLLHTEMPKHGLLDAGSASVRGRLQICGMRMGCDAEDTSLSVGLSNITADAINDKADELFPHNPDRVRRRYMSSFGVDFTSATIEGGLDVGASYLIVESGGTWDEMAKDRNGVSEIELVWRDLLLNNPDGREILEQGFLESGWIDAMTRIERSVRSRIGPREVAVPFRREELVRNIIYGDLVFRSAEIKGGANFSGVRIGRIDERTPGNLDLGHTTIWGDLTVGSLALLRSVASEDLLPEGALGALFPSQAPEEAAHFAVSPTDIDGFVGGRFLTVHGDLTLHGPRADRLFDEAWTPGGREIETLLCSIDLDHHSSTYLYYVLHAAKNGDPVTFSGRERTAGGDGAVTRLDLALELTPGRELFTPPFSFTRVGLGLDFRNTSILGHLDLTNVRTNVRYAGGAGLNKFLCRKLAKFYLEREIKGFFQDETGRCEIMLADVDIGGDLRILSDRTDAIYGKDLQGLLVRDEWRGCEPAMWLRTVCARLDMESARIGGDTQLSGLEIYSLMQEPRSGSLYAADATVSGRFILERQETYYGRPKRARIERELGLPA